SQEWCSSKKVRNRRGVTNYFILLTTNDEFVPMIDCVPGRKEHHQIHHLQVVYPVQRFSRLVHINTNVGHNLEICVYILQLDVSFPFVFDPPNMLDRLTMTNSNHLWPPIQFVRGEPIFFRCHKTATSSARMKTNILSSSPLTSKHTCRI